MERENNSISIIVCSFNASLEDILLTLISSLKQDASDKQIIYCDDGSKNNYRAEIEDFFQKSNFKNFTLVFNKENQGTVKNIASGLKEVRHKYVKVIGAGDAFYSPSTCKDIVLFMEENDLDYAFSSSVFFYEKDELLTFNVRQPSLESVYELGKQNYVKIKKNLMIYNDFILGAALFYKTVTFKKSLDKLLGKIIYEEDAIVAESIINGAKIAHYPHYGVYYEYGSGISTTPNKKFLELLMKDKLELFSYIHKETPNKFSKKALKLAKVMDDGKKAQLKRTLIAPSKLSYKLKQRKSNKKQKETPDYGFYKLLKEEVKKYGL